MSNMKFYFTPGACSIGIHILLEELGLVFEAYPVNLVKGEQYSPEFLAINPKATVPVLVLEDGEVIEGVIAIALRLAKMYPQRKLLPEGMKAQIDMLDTMNFITSAVHGQGFTRIFTTSRYTRNQDEFEAVIEKGRNIVQGCLSTLDAKLSIGRVFSEQFSIADCALFYVEFWAAKTNIPLPYYCYQHYQAMLKRPAVRQVLTEEGYHASLSGTGVAFLPDVFADEFESDGLTEASYAVA